MNALAAMLLRLSGRERALIGVLLGIALPLVAVGQGLVPLARDRDAARAALAEADAVLRWVEAQAAAFPPRVDAAPADTGEPSLARLETSLSEAGLRDRVTALTDRGAGRVELRFDAVDYGALMAWLDAGAEAAGYRVGAFALEALPEPGRVIATLTLEPGP